MRGENAVQGRGEADGRGVTGSGGLRNSLFVQSPTVYAAVTTASAIVVMTSVSLHFVPFGISDRLHLRYPLGGWYYLSWPVTRLNPFFFLSFYSHTLIPRISWYCCWGSEVGLPVSLSEFGPSSQRATVVAGISKPSVLPWHIPFPMCLSPVSFSRVSALSLQAPKLQEISRRDRKVFASFIPQKSSLQRWHCRQSRRRFFPSPSLSVDANTRDRCLPLWA